MASAASYKKYETRRRNPDPKTCALLVIDVQRHFETITAPILPYLTTTISLCRAAHIPIIYTAHVDRPGRRGMLEEWWPNDPIPANSSASQLMLDIDGGQDLVVEKSTYSGFERTNLEEKLREMGVEEVIVAGVMTNLCCETTAREAFVKGFRVFFSADATATADDELHAATLKNLAYGFAYIVDCERLRAAFAANKS